MDVERVSNFNLIFLSFYVHSQLHAKLAQPSGVAMGQPANIRLCRRHVIPFVHNTTMTLLCKACATAVLHFVSCTASGLYVIHHKPTPFLILGMWFISNVCLLMEARR